MNTRFHIPDFNPLYNEVREYVREKQGQEKMVWLDYDEKDKCYALLFDCVLGANEEIIQAIRVDERNSLQIRIVGHWMDIKNYSYIYGRQTLMNIANIIEDILE